MFENLTNQPKHIDLTRFNFGGCNYWAQPFTNDAVSDERCSWCDKDCSVLLVKSGTADLEYACDKHADQYFFGAKVSN